MDQTQRIICLSEELEERGRGVRFQLPELDERATGFAIRFNGVVYAYVNRCAHLPVELDWNEGDFFNITQDYLICATHGAQYQPSNGGCVAGPCRGGKLRQLKVYEQDNQVLLVLDSI